MMNNLNMTMDRPIAFHRIFVKLTGSINAALFLSQALYWSSRGQEDGWFYKVSAEWEEETGLTRREQDGCRAKLKALGILEELRENFPARLWFRLNQEKLSDLLMHPTVQQDAPHGATGCTPRCNRMHPTVQQDAPNRQIFKGTETTTETTPETTAETTAYAEKPAETSTEEPSQTPANQPATTILNASRYPSPAIARAANPRPRTLRNPTHHFQRFWDSLPETERVARQECVMIWQAQNLDDQADVLIADFANRLANDQNWEKYHPAVKTYLNYQRWNDAVKPKPNFNNAMWEF